MEVRFGCVISPWPNNRKEELDSYEQAVLFYFGRDDIYSVRPGGVEVFCPTADQLASIRRFHGLKAGGSQ